MEGRQGLFLVLIMATCFYGNIAQAPRKICTQEAVADIVFLVDGSWSIGAENFEQIRRFLHTLVNSFDVNPDHVRIGLVQYSTNPRTEFLLNTFQTKRDILQYISKLPYLGGGTHTGEGLDFMLNNHFVASAGSRAAQNIPQIAVVITDGKSQDNVESHAQKLKRKGIVLYAIGIKDADEDQLKEIANEPHSQHVYSVSDFAALQGISQNIVQTLCTTVEEAKRQLLQLSQACSQGNVADIVFLVDGSSSIGTSDFQEIRLFLRSLITGLDIGADKVRIGLAQYSDEPHKEFLLKDHMDKTSMLAAVENFPYRAGHTYTGKAIDFLVDQFFTEQAGSRARQRVPQIAVIITDGKSNDNVTKPAQRLRQHGVIVFGIGVGQADMVELEDIANRPSSRFRFKINNYQALQKLTEGLLQTVCTSADDQRNALAEKFSDIFFLVDGAEFQQWRGILTKLANQLNIGASAHRLGLAQYGQDIKVEFLLNAHQTKDETQKAIKTLRPTRRQPTDPRNLGSALRYARTHFFTQEAGSRADQGFRQYLVVLSGKNSDDTEFHRESRLIKSSGITVVGMSLKADVQDTRAISTASYSYQFNNNAVPILKAIFETEDEQKNVTGDCKGANKADIVFIIDESGSIGTPNFQMMRNFLYSIVNGLDISQSKVRVGIVMYNDNAEAQVYLNAFSHKNDLLNFIKILPYHGGGTKTGAALQFAQENVFVKSKGSRKDQGIQQVAVVITDGESQDQVDTPAANLRRAGVTVYSVGIKGANMTQLKQMASHPTNKHLFNVSSFSKLQSLQQSLQKTLCHNIIKKATADPGRINKDGCLQTDEADIFFLIDHSGSIEYNDFRDMKKFILEFLTTFRVGPQHVRVGVAKYSDSPNLEIDVTHHSDSKTLGKAVEAIEQKGGGTETGKALTFMGPLFIEAEKSRGHKVPQFLVVITDGESTDEVKIPAETLRAQGITVYAIGVRGAVEAQLLEIAGDPAKKFSVNNFDALNPIKDDIIRDICSKEACKDVPSDLIFLIDSSGSIRPDDFTTMKNFMISVISKSDIGEKNIHVGVMQYNTNGQLQFPLNRHYSKQALITAIDGIQQLGGGTHTGGAISSVSQYFDAAQGGRPDIRQRLIVITDGESQDVVKGPAAALREKGVLIYAIGVDEANSNQLLEISGSPDRMYSERDFNSLKGLESKITNELCDPGRECKKIEKADIIFLVDFSKSISQAEFGSMEKYMISVVDQSSVGKDLTRFGVILYSDDPTSVFSLKQYDNKKDVFKAIKGMTIKRGDTYTGKALKYSLEYFNSQWGGRKSLNVPQILMVITDGEATDQYSLEEPSKALRDNGIDVFSIGVKGANQAELKIMAGDESRVFFVSDFNALETLYKMVGPALCNSTKKRCPKQKADLVFLLDQSSSIQPDDYKLMKNFTINIVNTFNVSNDYARIGLARFSTGFRDEFYLDKFNTNKAVNGYISNLVQQGGDTYLGDALKKIKEYFQASRGGRKSSGISQNLVIITDGEAHDSDDIEDAANHLRSIGIQMFVIGIGDIHDLELLQIAGTPKRLFTVNDFKSLESIKQKVIDTVCDPDVYPNLSEGCSIDIAMGFDISRVRNPGEMLTDGHTKLWTFLPDIAQYVTSVSNLCCAKKDSIEIKIGFSLVNRNGVVLENFDKIHGYDRDLVTKVMNYNLKEPTYFNTALLQSFAKKFKEESRSGTKVLVIFSDGLDEDVWKLEEEAEKLKQAGINALLVVALEGARNPAELQMVEFGRGFDYKLPLNIGMHSVAHTMLKQIDTVSDRVCCGVMCKCSGNEGVRGGRGGPGTKGVSGQKGYPGFPGEEGTAGDRGPPGPSGPQGVQGCSGIRGPKGFRGLRGDRGSNGEDGLDGVNGEQGVTGKEGSRGERGHSGNSGIPGIRGEAGIKGQRGLRGDPGNPGRSNTVPGPKGDAGSPGLPGAPGPDGKVAESGVVGQPGPNGRRGPPGESGQTGAPGDPGLPGIPGAFGPQGKRGPIGIAGEKGWPGLPGPQGGPGTAGGRGLAGRRGPNGGKGQPGETGGQGDKGASGSLGMPGQDGRDGYGKAGTPGAKGDPGFPGYPGLQGEDGIKGTSGYPGRKGNLGRGGNSGRSGETGGPGEPGRPGHAGTRGPSGRTAKSECELVTYIRDNCACSLERSACPAYPTELVFGLDMSQDVKAPQFERQRDALLSLLEDIHISESNCPTGARVAVVGYSAYTKYLIRFQDYREKKQLIAFVKNIALERTSNKRNLGAAMSFVGQTLFKRVRSGIMMRKVAVFFSAGPNQDRAAVTTAMMEYRGQNIVPAVISLDNAPAIDQAMQVDDSGTSIFTVLRGDMAADLRRVKNCAICYDPCKRAEECSFIQEPLKPQEVDMDLVMVLDGSREVQADDFSGGQQLLVSLVEQLAVSSQPRGKNTQARVAMVQQSGGSRGGVGAEFGFQTFNSNHLMVEYISRNMTQRSGASALGQTVEYAYKELLMKAPQPRRKKCLLTVVGTQTAYEDRVKLNYISQKAKCEGVATFVVTVGERYNRTEVEQLAGLPTVQHLIHFNRMKAEEQGYAKRFVRVFFNSLNKGVNTYPHQTVKSTCGQLIDRGQEVDQGQEYGQAGLGQEGIFGDESFQEQTGRRSQTGQIDVIEALTHGGSSQGVISRPRPNAQCELRADSGFQCGAAYKVWFFDVSVAACSPLWYNGCGGNANRFNTENECFRTCVGNNRNLMQKPVLGSGTSKDACLLAQDPGSCQDYTMMWFYDTTQNECSRFWYGGCNGNSNRFKTQEDCENLCVSL